MLKAKNLKIPDNPEYRKLKEYIDENKGKRGSILQILLEAQRIFGYLPEEVQYFIAKETGIPSADIYGIITFYNFFRTEPIGKYLINICRGTACHVKGSEDILEALSKHLNVKIGGTTKDRLFTLSTARCFGACGLAPVMMINNEVYGRLNPTKAVEIIKEIKEREV